MNFLMVGVGGLFGSMLRYGISLLIAGTTMSQSRIPWATLTVNVIGSFLLVAVIEYLRSHEGLGNGVFLLLGIGFCGGFTTFSTFSWEVIELLKSGLIGMAFGYALLSLLASVGAGFLGMFLVSKYFV